MTEIYKELAFLRRDLNCNKILFTCISVFLSIVVPPVIFLALLAVVIGMFIKFICCYVALPFIVLYQCIKHKCNFILED